MESRLQTVLEEIRHELARMYGDQLRHVVLYGSQARGQARPGSDVDVLVVLKGPLNLYQETKRPVSLQMQLFERYRLDFSFMPYDEKTYQDTHRSFVRNVHAEGIEL